jgi:hypothetical protein
MMRRPVAEGLAVHVIVYLTRRKSGRPRFAHRITLDGF